MFIMYNILSTFIIPMKGISKQTSDLLLSLFFSSLNILFIHKNTGGFARAIREIWPVSPETENPRSNWSNYVTCFFILMK